MISDILSTACTDIRNCRETMPESERYIERELDVLDNIMIAAMESLEAPNESISRPLNADYLRCLADMLDGGGEIGDYETTMKAVTG